MCRETTFFFFASIQLHDAARRLYFFAANRFHYAANCSETTVHHLKTQQLVSISSSSSSSSSCYYYYFPIAKVASITAMIYFHIILHPAVHIYNFHIFVTSSSSFHGFITNQFNDLLPVGLLAQWVRALHRSRSGQGFQSRASLFFFFAGFLFATAKVASITSMIYFHIIPSPRSSHIFVHS